MQDLIDHAKEVTKTIAGGFAVGGTTYAGFDIATLTQYASFAAAVATTIYFIVATVLAIRNRDNK
jgi:hypothetical protein